MFYLKEVSFRAQFFFLSSLTVTGLCYSYKKLLLFLLTFNPLNSNSKECFLDSGADYFIYTHPSELFTTYFLIVFHFSFILTFHLVLWHLMDFSKSSLKRLELDQLTAMIKITIGALYLLNFLFLDLIFPNCWNFFESFNENSDKSTLKFFLELKIKDYVNFLESLLYTINLCFILIFALYSLINFQHLKVLIKWKKLFFLLNLMVITICGSSDLVSQILGLIILIAFLELTILLRTIILKIKKYMNIRRQKGFL